MSCDTFKDKFPEIPRAFSQLSIQIKKVAIFSVHLYQNSQAVDYSCTLLIRNSPLVALCSRSMPRALRWP